MQASTHLIKANLEFEISKRRDLPCFRGFKERKSTLSRDLCIPRGSICSGLSSGAVSMGAELARARDNVETAARSLIKFRSVKAQASVW